MEVFIIGIHYTGNCESLIIQQLFRKASIQNINMKPRQETKHEINKKYNL